MIGTLVAVIIATKLLGDIAQRLRQPTVLGELIAGVLLGASVLGWLNPGDPVISAFAEIGVLILLFEIGLQTDLRTLAAVGRTATMVALVGVAVPFALGYLAAVTLGVSTIPALVCGAALTATSIGISARVLSDIGRLDSPEGQVILGAAVLDDIVGLVILAVVAGVAGGVTPTASRVVWIVGSALGFLAIAVLAGRLAAPPLFRIVEGMRVSGALPLLALAFALGLSWLAHEAGSAPIVGAFTAGLLLHPTPQRELIQRGTTTIGHFFVPIFFAAVGASVRLDALAASGPLIIGGVLIGVAIIGKIVAGYAPWWFSGSKLLVGVGMIPRGEVGLIFAQMGLAAGALTSELFGAVMMMVLVTTLVTPPLLTAVGKRLGPPRPSRQFPDVPGDGGIDDLVAGARSD